MGACANCVDPDPRECAEFPSFKTLTQDQVSLIIGKVAMKSCPLDPAPTSVHVVLQVFDVLLPVVTCMINMSFESGLFAEEWRQAPVLPCLVPRPHYYARPMRFGSRGPRKFLRPRQTRRSETFCLTWGGAFGSGRAVNNFSALMKDVQEPWRVQKNEHFYSMHVLIVESRLAFLFHLSH